MTYQSTDQFEISEVEERTHKNGDRTVVAVIEYRDWYTVLVQEYDPDGELLANEVVATTQTEGEAVARADAWRDRHPKGLDEQDGGLLSKLGGG